jgi:2-methylcitrate dehydratase PrpD
MTVTSVDRDTTTQRLVRHLLSYRQASLPQDALTVAKQCVLDWFAVTLAAYDEPLACILRDQAGKAGAGTATIVGTSSRCAPAEAALVNGATSHALDYDDGHHLVGGHPTVAIFPAALAIAETLGSSGRDLLRALIVGMEAEAAIGSLALPEHYDRGFHATGTLGAFGAAAAAGFLLDLDETQMAMALGLAGTQAAGLKAMFGTMAKPFHAGKASSNGVLAACLAKRGFTAHADILDAPQGFLDTQGRSHPSRDIRLLPPGEVILDTLFKFHAACFLTHSTIEAVSYLRDTYRFAPGDIASIDLHVHPGHLAACNIPSPQSGLEVKFSLRHLAALVVCGADTAAIGAYTDETAHRPDAVALHDFVRVHGDGTERTAAEVRIGLKSGESINRAENVGVPLRDFPSQQVRLERKYHSLTQPVLGAEASERLCANIKSMDQAGDVETILRQARSHLGEK